MGIFRLSRFLILSLCFSLGLIFSIFLSTNGLLNAASVLKSDPVVMAAGDIACDPQSPNFNGGKGTKDACKMMATSDVVLKVKPTAVLALGDNQYERGELVNYQKSYDPSWGRFKNITRPVPGNHEYYGNKAEGYYQYFGRLAGDRNKGYYSYDLGNWHLIAINSNCDAIGGCQAGSPQEQWLKADLKKNKKSCTLAYWHHPRFSSGVHGNNKMMDDMWKDLYAAKAELVLSGHDHLYERFAPQGLTENADPKNGIRQIVIGNGGKNLYTFKTIRPNSEVRNDDSYGVLKVTLHKHSYDWELMSIAGDRFTDKGTTLCH